MLVFCNLVIIGKYNAIMICWQYILFSFVLEMLQTMLKDSTYSTTLEDWIRTLLPQNKNNGKDRSDDDE